MKSANSDTNESIRLLKNWYRRIRVTQKAHYQDARRLKRINFAIGLAAILLSGFVGTKIFLSLEKSPNQTTQIITGLLSVVSASLITLQNSLNYSKKSEKHLSAARKLSLLKKRIEETLSVHSHEPKKLKKFISYVRKKWIKVTNQAPLLTDKNLDKYIGEQSSEDRMPKVK